MIAYLKGEFTQVEPTHLVVEAGGIGYKVLITLNTYQDLKALKTGKVLTHFHVKEDSHTLFGFSAESERAMFLSLLSISGVGPSTAIMMLSSLDVIELKRAIVNGDVKTIQAVKGIGAKTAQRVILELRDKVAKEGDFEGIEQIISHSHNTLKDEALSALTTLGIGKNVAEKSVNDILKKSGNTITLEELIKLALKTA
jgi:Holliday junction DNA helicase RuvA